MCVHCAQVSESIREMMQFMETNRDKDYLVTGFPNKKDNPFQEKGGCTII